MPSILLEVPETYDNSTRPVTTELVKDLINQLQLPNDTGIRYFGTAGVAAQKGSLLANHQQDIGFRFTQRVDVNQEETYLENHTLTTATRSRENPPVFVDSQLGVSIHPIYTRTQSVLQFVYRARDKTAAFQWRDHLRRKSSEGMQALLHNVTYHYSVPEPFMSLLDEIHFKRESVEGYGDSFNDYLLTHFTPRLTTLSNLDASRKLGAITEKQIEIQGWFDFETEPSSVEKDKEGETWEISFTYTVQYDKVTSMVMFYPIVVHNQLIGDEFVISPEVSNPYSGPRLGSRSARAFDGFRFTQEHLTRKGVEPVVIPPHDDWTPKGTRFKTLDILTTLVGVDYSDPTLVLNLGDMGEASLEPDILAFIDKHKELFTEYLGLPFLGTFYVQDQMVAFSDIYIDSDLNVRTVHPMDPRNVHHFKLAVLSDLRNLSLKGQEALKRHPSVMAKVLELIYRYHNPLIHESHNNWSVGNPYITDPNQQRPSNGNANNTWGHVRGDVPTKVDSDAGRHNPIKTPPHLWRPGRGGNMNPSQTLKRRPNERPTPVGGKGQRAAEAAKKHNHPTQGPTKVTGDNTPLGNPAWINNNTAGDFFEDSPAHWIVVNANGVVTDNSWQGIVDALSKYENGFRKSARFTRAYLPMQTVMQAGIVAHPNRE